MSGYRHATENAGDEPRFSEDDRMSFGETKPTAVELKKWRDSTEVLLLLQQPPIVSRRAMDDGGGGLSALQERRPVVRPTAVRSGVLVNGRRKVFTWSFLGGGFEIERQRWANQVKQWDEDGG